MDLSGQAPVDPNLQDPSLQTGMAPQTSVVNQTPINPIPVVTELVLDTNSQIVVDSSDINQGSTLINDSQTNVAQIQPESPKALENQSNINQPNTIVQPLNAVEQVQSNPTVIPQANNGQAQSATDSALPQIMNNLTVPAGENVGSVATLAQNNIDQNIVQPVNEVKDLIADNVSGSPATGWGSIIANNNPEISNDKKEPQNVEVAAAPAAEIVLGTLSGKTAGDKITDKPGMVEGLVSGSNIKVARKMSQDNGDKPETKTTPDDIKPVKNKHPLTELYAHLEEMANNSQLMAEQEMAAEKRHQSLDQIKDEAAGWQLTGKIANILMIFSWAMAIISLFFPYIFKASKSNNGFSADFILFIVTIMLLLTCTILSFWINSNKVFKMVTWGVFLFFVLIFVLIAMKSGGLIGGNGAFLNTFLNRFSM